jgi:SNF2 family DNA or RNA helicase
MEIVADKVLVLKTRKPDRVEEAIPTSKVLNTDGQGIYTMAMNWGVTTAQKLAELKMKNIPSPMQGYSWPGLSPMAHQIKTADHLVLNQKSAMVFNEQGTGKTASCIWAADHLMNQGLVSRVLVVAPLSTLQATWITDLHTFAPHRTAAVCHGTKTKRINILERAPAYEWIIINPDGISTVKNEIAEGGFDLIIIDEANAYKNPSTRRFKTLARLKGTDTSCWILTGTPATQSPVDAYGLAAICLSPERREAQGLPANKTRFRDLTMYPVSRFKWVPKPDATSVVHRILQPAIRFSKESCLDLPDTVYVDRIVEMTKEQTHYYRILRDQFLLDHKKSGNQVTAVNAATNLNKLLQISGGCCYSDSGEVIEFDISNRLQVVEDLIAESLSKVLVFCPFRHTIELVQKHLNTRGIGAEVIMGGVSLRKRSEIIERFQKFPETKVLVCQPAAAGHGLNLTAASSVVWFSPVVSVEQYLQSNARIARPAQKLKMTITRLAGSAAESKLYRMLSDKLKTHTQIVNLYNDILHVDI